MTTVALAPVAPADKSVLANLVQFYCYEFSAIRSYDVTEHGTFVYRYVDHFVVETDRDVHFVRVDGALAGFVMTRVLPTGEREMSEFFVMRRHRRGGVGTRAAEQAFALHPGPWHVAFDDNNVEGKRVLAQRHRESLKVPSSGAGWAHRRISTSRPSSASQPWQGQACESSEANEQSDGASASSPGGDGVWGRSPHGNMKLGMFGLGMGALSTPQGIADAATAVEEAGFDSLWAGEHVVLPDPQAPPSPMPPGEPALDPLLALAWAGFVTNNISLATGIVIVPQRNPVVLAKQIASLDQLVGGRFVFGVGVGYLEPEFRAIGANFEERGAVTDEFIDAMQRLWYDDKPSYDGDHVAFGGIDAHPRPAQRPIPIVVGGRSRPAYRRAIARGHGWYGFALTPETAAPCLDGLRAAAETTERPAELGELKISITPWGRLTEESVAAFAALGVHRLVPMIDTDGISSAAETVAAASR